MESKEDIKRLFRLYLAGRTNPLQEKLLFRHLHAGTLSEKELDELANEQWVKEPAPRLEGNRAAQGLDKLWDRIGHSEPVRKRRYGLLKYAAVALLFVTVGLSWYSYQLGQQESKTEKLVQLVTKSTLPGEKKKVVLPDSSIVYLGGGSTLSWPNQFAEGPYRNIFLEGEAFFEVKRDTLRPFTVRSGNLQTRVLGTSFNVYSYPSDNQSSVLVKSGKVEVSELSKDSTRQLSVLTSGMELTYQRDHGTYAVNKERTEDADSWAHNRFVFRDEPMENILRKLERYYNIQFMWQGDPGLDCPFNATFDKKSIKEVMDELQIMSGGKLHYRVSGDNDKITLWGGVCR
ncbi:FecR family protein [Parapedobacter tibetensis]|uniref:FecR family protein n=1 Tax=Parapedobacter tibetensis TaxID=2972951 RepID=UPI00214DCEB1|nr:FecR family protein [Parapedobacter tibetensis]